MSLDVSTFLARIAADRQREQDAARTGIVLPLDLKLPESLEIALRHRFLIRSVLARSAHALNSAGIGVPSCDRRQLEFWYAQFGNDANWLLQLGDASGVVAVKIELQFARYSLESLAGDDNSWLRTLRFSAGNRWFVLFKYLTGLLPLASFPGLSLHKRSSILIPPSRTPSEVEFVFADPQAQLLPFPGPRETSLRR